MLLRLPASVLSSAVLIASAGVFAPRSASAGALDVAADDKIQPVQGVEILAVTGGEVVYRLFSELDAGKNVVHRRPLAEIVRVKEHDAATFTHAEWHRTDLKNYRMAEDGYRQALREAAAGRAPKWSLTAAWARLVNLYLQQHRITEAIEAFVGLIQADGQAPEKFLPAAIVTADARAYDRGVRAVHALLAEAVKAARPAASASAVALAERLEFRGPSPLREKGFLGIDDPAARRVVFVLARNGPAEDPTVRAATAAAIRRLQEGQEFAVFYGAERSAAVERRVALNGATVRSEHEPGRLTSVRADPRCVFDALPPPPDKPPRDSGGDWIAGLEAALRMSGTREPAAPDAVYLVVGVGSADWDAVVAAVAALNPTADGRPRTRLHVIVAPVGTGPIGADEADGRRRALAERFGGRYRRYEPEEWRRIWTCR
jgi:hypothetical protein